MDKQITHKEHFVPRVYLRGFSEDQERIHFYNKNKKEYSKTAVPIEDVCRQIDLYEFMDKTGNLLHPNFIENAFANIEKRFGKERDRIVRSAQHESNYKRDNFFSDKTHAFWIMYCLLQVLRSPHVIKEGQLLFKEMISSDEIDAKNASLYYSFPFWEEVSEESKNTFCKLLKPWMSMDILVGVVKGEDSLFTSDNPIYCYAPTFPCDEYGKIVFPLTSKICILFYGESVEHGNIGNKMFYMSQELIDDVKWSIAYSANNFIYSEQRLNRSDIALIRNAHRSAVIDKKDKGEFTL